MHFLKHLKTFEFFTKNVEFEKPVTYNPNGDHAWDENDTIITLYYFKLREKNSSFEDVNSKVDFDIDNFERELQNNIGLTSIELAENIIGCSEGSLKQNTDIIDHLITGRETGRKHPNKHQIKIAKNMGGLSIEELKNMADTIINNIENDEERLAENKKAKEIRAEFKKRREINKEAKTKKQLEEDRTKSQREKGLSKHNITNGRLIDNTESEQLNGDVGTEIEHPKFGHGVITEIGNSISMIKFDNDETPRRMGNKFINKFI